jgi:Flp pilus assembly protein TadD
MRRTSTIATIVGLVLWISTSALAQQDVGQGTGDLHGKVLDRDGKPLQGAIVRVRSNGTGQVDEGKTNKNGAFSLVGLTQGKYTASLIVNGQAVMQRGVDTGDEIYVAVSQDLPVNFDMRKAPSTPVAVALPPPPANAGKPKSDAEKKADQEMRAAFNTGMAALKAQNYDEAVKQLQLASEKNATEPAVFGNLGLALLRTKKWDDAAAAFKKSLALNPADGGVHALLSRALGEAGKVQEALQEAEEGARLDPTKAGESYYNLGAILSEKGKLKQGVELFKKAIEIDPKYAPSYYQLGVAYFGSTDTIPQAVSALEKYLQMEPNGSNAEAAKQLIAAAKATAPADKK